MRDTRNFDDFRSLCVRIKFDNTAIVEGSDLSLALNGRMICGVDYPTYILQFDGEKSTLSG
jgi:hypothetical protein